MKVSELVCLERSTRQLQLFFSFRERFTSLLKEGQKMETPQEVVLRILQALGAEHFETFNWHLQQEGALNDFPAIPRCKLEKETRLNTVDMMLQTYSKHIIDVTRIVLVKMNLNDLVKKLPRHGEVNTPEDEEIRAECQQNLKSKLDRKFQRVFEGIAKEGEQTVLDQMFTEIYLLKGGAAEVNDQHEVRQIETASRKPDRPEPIIRQEDIFKTPPGRDEPIRTVMTTGVAGIGKTSPPQWV
ncbi:NACHT, LRR and PYD domains-containing protein 3-like [Etheostoma spectabile]|uniref:NACHT, LRR and PYD domains-containing protein 3-like n=1 Tax=Etheostoma spectabile TaxID=54343 RepID=UPI0013AF3287|nr:NACHT, LRR and PYD domains-containing protein 3-like [Etheostoma spectabile]